MAQQNQNQNQAKDQAKTEASKTRTGANIALQAIAAIKKGDHFNTAMPKVETWLSKLTEAEKRIVFKNLERVVTVEEAKVLISQIVSKDEADMYKTTALMGLLNFETEDDRFQEVMLDSGIGNPAETEIIETWLLSISEREAEHFRVALNRMEPEKIIRIFAWLSGLPDDNTRTTKTKARGLLPRN